MSNLNLQCIANLYLLSECPNLNVPYAVIKGNMHYEGTKRKVICNADTQYQQAFISVCRNGRWTRVPTCRIGMNGPSLAVNHDIL